MASTANDRPIYPKDLALCTAPKKLINQTVVRGVGSSTPLTLVESSVVGVNGGLVHSLFLVPLGANVASVFRLFLLSGGEYHLMLEQTLPAIVSASEAAQLDRINIELPELGHIPNTKGLFIRANCGVACGLGTAVASGYNVFLQGGTY